MAQALTRHAGAVERICGCIAAVTDIPANRFGRDDDLVDDIGLDELELESLALIIEEVFDIRVSADLWKSPIYRTPASLAEYCIRKSEEAGWAETQRQRKRA